MSRERSNRGEATTGGEKETWAPMTPAMARMLGLEQMARTYWRHRVRRSMGRLAATVARLFGAG